MTILCVTYVLRTVIVPHKAEERPPSVASAWIISNAYLLCSILSFERKKYWPTSICLFSSKKFWKSLEFVYVLIFFYEECQGWPD